MACGTRSVSPSVWPESDIWVVSGSREIRILAGFLGGNPGISWWKSCGFQGNPKDSGEIRRISHMRILEDSLTESCGFRRILWIHSWNPKDSGGILRILCGSAGADPQDTIGFPRPGIQWFGKSYYVGFPLESAVYSGFLGLRWTEGLKISGRSFGSWSGFNLLFAFGENAVKSTLKRTLIRFADLS